MQIVDVRIVSATHADLSSAAREGKFRHDLFFRLNVYPIHLPPLRDRIDDIPLLAEHFLRKFACRIRRRRFRRIRLRSLKSRPWPGNVRELRNALEHAAIEARGGPLRPEHFPEPSSASGPASTIERLRSLVTEWCAKKSRALEGREPADLHLKLIEVDRTGGAGRSVAASGRQPAGGGPLVGADACNSAETDTQIPP